METKTVAPKVPEFNAKLGDLVKYKGQLWGIIQLGLINSGGYPLDILIKHKRKTLKVSPFGDEIFIYPAIKEIPTKLLKWSKANKVHVVRDPNNSDQGPTYRMVCPDCDGRLWVKSVTQEGGELCFSDDAFDNGSLEILESYNVFRCSCPDKEYDEPENFEIVY